MKHLFSCHVNTNVGTEGFRRRVEEDEIERLGFFNDGR
jgi:hypothetical protein